MGLAVSQLAAYLHDQCGAVLLEVRVLTLLGGKGRIHFLKLKGSDCRYLTVKGNVYLGEVDLKKLACVADNAYDSLNGGFKIVERSVLASDHLLPIPLVNVDGVDIVKLLVATDGVHIGVKTVAYEEIVLLKGKTLPLCKRVHHLSAFAYRGNVKGYGTLYTVKVVVESRAFRNEKGRAYTLKIKGLGKSVLKGSFYKGYSLLRFINVKLRLIAFGNVKVAHCELLFRINRKTNR